MLPKACVELFDSSFHSTEPFDPRKKGGRYKNEFIWNTNWQVGVL